MSAYAYDPRVQLHADGTATVPDALTGDWRVERSDCGWVGWHYEQGFLRDRVNGRYRALYGTCDEVLARLLGPAKTPA